MNDSHALQDPAQENGMLRAQLADAHDATMRLRDEWISRRDFQIKSESELAQMRQALAARDVQLEQVQREMQQMRSTKIWQLGTLYWRAHA